MSYIRSSDGSGQSLKNPSATQYAPPFCCLYILQRNLLRGYLPAFCENKRFHVELFVLLFIWELKSFDINDLCKVGLLPQGILQGASNQRMLAQSWQSPVPRWRLENCHILLMVTIPLTLPVVSPDWPISRLYRPAPV